MPDLGADPIAVQVGARLRLFRKQRKVTQRDLADALQLTFQQVQKYETGASRMTASKLWDAAQFLNVHVADFFDSQEGETPNPLLGLTLDAETRQLLQAWVAIDHPEQRAAVVSLVRSLTLTSR